MNGGLSTLDVKVKMEFSETQVTFSRFESSYKYRLSGYANKIGEINALAEGKISSSIPNPSLVDAEINFTGVREENVWTPKIMARIQEMEGTFLRRKAIYEYEGISYEELELTGFYEWKRFGPIPIKMKAWMKGVEKDSAHDEKVVYGLQIMELLVVRAWNYYRVIEPADSAKGDPLARGKNFMRQMAAGGKIKYTPF